MAGPRFRGQGQLGGGEWPSGFWVLESGLFLSLTFSFRLSLPLSLMVVFCLAFVHAHLSSWYIAMLLVIDRCLIILGKESRVYVII